MKKAKLFKGIKIQLPTEKGYEDMGVENIVTSLETYYSNNKDYHPLLAGVKLEDIKVLETDIDLYEVVSCKPDGDINLLMGFRRSMKSPNCYRNSRFLTIEEIDKEMQDGYVIAVRGLKEIKSVDELK